LTSFRWPLLHWDSPAASQRAGAKKESASATPISPPSAAQRQPDAPSELWAGRNVAMESACGQAHDEGAIPSRAGGFGAGGTRCGWRGGLSRRFAALLRVARQMDLARYRAGIAANLREPLRQGFGGCAAHGDGRAFAGAGGLQLARAAQVLAHRGFK